MNSKQKPSLVMDARMINTSGIGTVCQNTIPYLLNDFQITLLGNPSDLKQYTWATNLKVISLKSSIYSFKEQLELFLKTPSCDFFFSPHYNVPILPIKAKKRVVIIHDVNHVALSKELGLMKKIYARSVIKLALAVSDTVITVSNFSKSEIIKYFNINKEALQVIVLGVDKTNFKVYTKGEQDKIRIKYNLPERFLLYVGNVKPHKNLSVLIKSFALLKAQGVFFDYKLVIVGKKEGFITADQAIAKEIATLGLSNDIIFTGYVRNEDLPVIYNIATLFVFPSLYEGFGLPPIEAMACGCPTVVSNSSSLPEVCQDATLYFNPENPDDLAATIFRVLDSKSLQEQLRLNGSKLVDNYNWETTAQQLKEIILAK